MKTFELGYWIDPDGAGSATLNLASSFVEARLLWLDQFNFELIKASLNILIVVKTMKMLGCL